MALGNMSQRHSYGRDIERKIEKKMKMKREEKRRRENI